MIVVLRQLLQSVAVDVKTHTRLGMCIAVRIKDVIQLLCEDGMNRSSLTKSTIEAEMLSTSYCSKSQQKFMDPKSTDTTIKPSVRGLGGNQTTQRCIIIQQSMLDEEQVDLIRRGACGYIQKHTMTSFSNDVIMRS